MTKETRNSIVEELFGAIVDEAMNSKGDAYSGDGDVLSNFKRNAERLGLTPFQIWHVYCAKHEDTISNAIKDNPEFPHDKTEGLRGRIIDVITYHALLWCLLNDPDIQPQQEQID